MTSLVYVGVIRNKMLRNNRHFVFCDVILHQDDEPSFGLSHAKIKSFIVATALERFELNLAATETNTNTFISTVTNARRMRNYCDVISLTHLLHVWRNEFILVGILVQFASKLTPMFVITDGGTKIFNRLHFPFSRRHDVVLPVSDTYKITDS